MLSSAESFQGVIVTVTPASEYEIAISAPSNLLLRRVVLATIIGSVIEAFDWLAYGTAAALVFNKLFFPTFDATAASLAAFSSFAAGFFARPIGGLIFGHFGDRLGRKTMLMLSLVLMGGSTVLIGLLPTYASIGWYAAVFLVILRIVQGISFGGELTGAMLMAVEHAPARFKSFFGSLPQGGTPVGLLLSTGAFALVTQLPEQEFLSWGWRIPFLASAVLVAVGIFIRLKVAESPEFAQVRITNNTVRFPAKEVLAQHWRSVLLTLGGKVGEVTLYFTIVVFSLSYVTSKLGFTRAEALQAITIGGACQIVTIPFFGWLADKVGVRQLYACGGVLLALMGVPLLLAIGSGNHIAYQIAVVVGLGVNYAIMFGPQSRLYAAQFPAALRFSGMSIGINIAAALGGGLAPLMATTLLANFGSLGAVGLYISTLGAISAICAYLMRSPTDE
jgi:MFS transporter, MHS family, shikimate and dehydroshikimate transport protein